MKISRTLALLLLSAGLLADAAAAAPAGSYFRFPAVRGDTVVFTAEGDLWKSNRARWRGAAPDHASRL